MRFVDVARLIEDALGRRAFPAAVIEVGRASGPLWSQPFGRLRSDRDGPLATEATVFDLASLTKVIATTALIQQALKIGHADLDMPLTRWLPEWPHGEAIRLRHLLDHSSGLASTARIWTSGARSRAAYVRAIAQVPIERSPGVSAVYSDLGFMLLGAALESHRGTPLDRQFHELARDLGLGDVTYLPPRSWDARTAATEIDPWRGRLLVGEVHDENAWALGGAAGHAGLFGTAGAVGAFARAVLRSFYIETAFSTPALSRLTATATGVPSSSRALGWDTMRPTSSCGRRLSPTAIGHTGFTGTSLWIDWERDFYVVLLTNRVNPTRENGEIQVVRPAVHDAVVAALDAAER